MSKLDEAKQWFDKELDKAVKEILDRYRKMPKDKKLPKKLRKIIHDRVD